MHPQIHASVVPIQTNHPRQLEERVSKKRALDPARSDQEHPLDRVSALSYVTVAWLGPLLTAGYNAPLDDASVWPLAHADRAATLQTKLDAAWTRECRATMPRHGRPRTPRFAVALWHAKSRTMRLAIAVHLVSAALTMLQPMLIKALLQFLRDSSGTSATAMFGVSSGYALAAMLGMASFFGATAFNFGLFLTARAGCNAQLVALNSIFRKTLRLKPAVRRSVSAGDVVMLVSVDSERVLNAVTIGLWAVVSPLMLVALATLIGLQMGVHVGLAAAATITLVVALALLSSHRMGVVRQQIALVTADRVQRTSEALHSIRVLKLYGWESFTLHKIQRAREREVTLLREYASLRLFNSVLVFLAPLLVNAVCFTVHVLRLGPRSELDVATAFAVLALSNATKTPLSIFGDAAIYVAEARTATRRIAAFLQAAEENEILHDPPPQSDTLRHEQAEHVHARSTPTVAIEQADFLWRADVVAAAATSDLTNISLALAPRSLTIVVGAMGSGKTSLLHALLGELEPTRGIVTLPTRGGSMAFASQQPWILNCSVRGNIVFADEGKDGDDDSAFDAHYYQRVLSACQLDVDLAAMDDGDATELGERGSTLSGGQRARISVARALYRAGRRGCVLLLDDPLSALDERVANALFAEGINGLAASATRVLVLNSHYHLLQHAHRVLVMDGGRIVGDGSPDQIRELFPALVSPSTTKEVEHLSPSSDAASPNIELADVGLATATVAKDTAVNELEAPPTLAPKQLMQEEDHATGSVGPAAYLAYLRHCGWHPIVTVASIVALFAAAQVALFLCDWQLSRWADGTLPSSLSQRDALAVYVSLVALAAMLVFARGRVFTEVCLRCSTYLHAHYLHNVFAASVPQFFDVAPVGRILNRFSRDLDQVDAPLPYVSMWMLFYSFQIAAAFLVCAATNPYVTILYAPLAAAFIMATRFFQRSARELKRLDSITRSPFLALISETLGGMGTIRAHDAQAMFARRGERVLDRNAKFAFAYQSAMWWFAMRTDWLVASVVVTVALLAVAMRASVGAAMAGLALTYAAQLTSSFQRATVLATQTDTVMTSFQRLAHYDALPAEGRDNVDDDVASRCSSRELAPPASWPHEGTLVFESVSMRYRAELPLVLRDVSFCVRGGESVGVCGRTGSGKASLANVLFRTVSCASGRVLLDGVDLARVPLHLLRAKLAIIPQEPTLFRGSLRDNLDPGDAQTDDELWRALELVDAADVARQQLGGLDAPSAIADRGENVSAGTRQLLCIARALVRRARVVLLDEATASVDRAADTKLQRALRACLGAGDTTVVCVAHRLDAVARCDKALLLAHGSVAAFGAPCDVLPLLLRNTAEQQQQ